EIYDQIITAADLKKSDVVLEVGPGLGFLTAKLAKAVSKVVAVELDDKLAAYLRDAITNSNVGNVEIVNKNILDVKILDIFSEFQITNSKFHVVANLPYNITSVFLRKFLTAELKPETMTLLLQKEVAERICAKPGKMSLLALSVQFYAEPKIISYVPKENFWPTPEVDSAIIRIQLKNFCHCERNEVKRSNPAGNSKSEIACLCGRQASPGARNDKEKDFFRLAKFGFSTKRKMLKNNLAAGLHISPAETEKILVASGFNPKIRAEDLGVEDWEKITERIAHNA
ncbi:MAG TPA: 16S rRNA (adenine(1518)-N(6)/adenine(1519)-N(6))-dimethyltransferase RsmA, partial [Candidatus Methylomirabilis sp.]|nr:16S rRNA (adenine(1518)-N(6)/adenine(1519)-N(6))-dimethyltransferase RsmA [Candidatus Methylomirabilis sp.]